MSTPNIGERIKPKVSIREEDRPVTKEPPVTMYIFICPTPGCGNYFASTEFQPGDSRLEVLQTRRGDQGPVETRTRRDCPDCWLRESRRVPRVPHLVTAVVALDDLLAAHKKIEARNRMPEESVSDSSTR